MKKTILSLILILSLSQLFAQKDTVYIPVLVYDKTDTVQVSMVLYKGPFGTVKYAKPGYKVQQGKAVMKGGKLQYIGKPELIATLNERKKKVKAL